MTASRPRPSRSVFVYVAALFFATADNARAANDFTGSWAGWICPPGSANNAASCSSFTLRLFQKEGHLCGTHLFATAGAKRMDEGGAPSLSGKIEPNTGIGGAAGRADIGGRDTSAKIIIESGRVSPPLRIPVTLTLNSAGSLIWERVERPAGDYLLPTSMTLTRSKQGSLLNPVFEQRLSAACGALLSTTHENDKPTPGGKR